jgi:hypothetical protein
MLDFTLALIGIVLGLILICIYKLDLHVLHFALIVKLIIELMIVIVEV